MGKVKIVTDSSCDIPSDLVKELCIEVVPMNIHFGTDTYLEGVTMSSDEFYARLVKAAPAIMPKTSQPSPGAFHEAYVRAARESREIISIHVSAALSGTYNSALTAARRLNESKDAHITVIDSRNASMCLGWTAMAAAEAAARGEHYAEIINLVLDMTPRLHI